METETVGVAAVGEESAAGQADSITTCVIAAGEESGARWRTQKRAVEGDSMEMKTAGVVTKGRNNVAGWTQRQQP